MLGPHVGPAELMGIVLMTVVTGIAWLVDRRRRTGRRV